MRCSPARRRIRIKGRSAARWNASDTIGVAPAARRGRRGGAGREHVAEQIAAQLAGVRSWDEFIGARILLDPDAAIPEGERNRLDALPSSVFLYGARVPGDYDVEHGVGVVRLRLKEGQSRR